MEGDESDRPPSSCPYGHRLAPGHVLVGWSPCQCSAAIDARRRGLWGHRTYTCWDCHHYVITSVCYVPPHIGGGHPYRGGTPGTRSDGLDPRPGGAGH